MFRFEANDFFGRMFDEIFPSDYRALKSIKVEEFGLCKPTKVYLDEETNELFFECKFPGFKKEEIDISLDAKNNTFFLTGKKKSAEGEDQNIKVVPIKEEIDLSSIRATLDLGMLRVSFKANKEKEEHLKIKIE